MDFEKWLNENPEQKERYERFTAEEKQQLAEAVKKVERIVEYLLPTIREVAKVAFNISKKIISHYPNKRVVYLATHSKKPRIRKKNMHRIIKDVQKGRLNTYE